MKPEITANLVDLAKKGKYLMLTQFVTELLRDMCDQAYQAGAGKGFEQGYAMGVEDTVYDYNQGEVND